MQHEDLPSDKHCIKLDLPTGEFTGLTEEQFVNQRHSRLDENSKWPCLEDQRSGSTIEASILDAIVRAKAEPCACLEKLHIELRDILGNVTPYTANNLVNRRR